MAKAAAKETSYKEMLGKVEAIVETVADPDIDLDELVGKVEEGYGLIRAMRSRLEKTKLKVEKLREEYDDLAEDDEAGSSPDKLLIV